MEPRQFLQWLLDRNDENPNSLAVKLNDATTQPQIYKYLKGISKEPKRATLAPVAKYFKIPLDALYSETEAEKAHAAIIGSATITLPSLSSSASNVIEINDHQRLKNRPEELVIPEFNTGGSMGTGLLLRDQPGVIRGWSVNQEWVSKNVKSHTGAANLCIVTGFGDSMKGMFNPGDPLLVDSGVKTVDFDAVYFFRVEGDGYIKRLQRIPGEGLRVLSENDKYESWTIKPSMDFEVLGRVLKAWQGEDF